MQVPVDQGLKGGRPGGGGRREHRKFVCKRIKQSGQEGRGLLS